MKTSKEALNQLYLWAVTPEIATETQFYCDIIEKDLEVLEIIKKHLYIVEPDNEEDLKEFDSVDYLKLKDYITRKEYEVLKEWLENDTRETNSK